jgi:hypothetical protein
MMASKRQIDKSVIGDDGDESPILTPADESEETSTRLEVHTDSTNEEARLDDDNDFDLEGLQVDQDFGASLGLVADTSKIIVTKPHPEWYVKTHPDPTYRRNVPLICLKDDDEIYIVNKPIWDRLRFEPTFRNILLIYAMNSRGTLFLWPIPLPGSDGKQNKWHKSAIQRAEEARFRWIRLISEKDTSSYSTMSAAFNPHQDPPWPDLSMKEVMEIAFREYRIGSWDHHVLKRLRGEAR